MDTERCQLTSPLEALDTSKWQRTVDLMVELYNAPAGAIVQFRQNEFCVISSSQNSNNFLPVGSSWPWNMRSFCRAVIESRNGIYVKQGDHDPKWKDSEPVAEGHIHSYYGLLLEWPNGTPFGSICVLDKQGSDYSETLLRVMQELRDLVNADIKLAVQYDQMRSLSLTDELTGLFNRRGLKTVAAQQLEAARRLNKNIGIMYMDVDNLKPINDKFGHDHGDKAIRLLAECVQKNLRAADIIARVGGDEFVALLFDTEPDAIDSIVFRLHSQYRDSTNDYPELAEVGLSIGCKLYSEHPLPELETMISTVDSLMYQQKKSRK